MIYIKSQNDIKLIRAAAEIWKKVKAALVSATKAGITKQELDNIAYKVMLDNNASPTFYGYGDFPGYICISVNDELIHGIPGIYKLKAGDLVTYDIGVTYNKRICDSAFSIIVPGKPNPEAQKIMDATYESLMESIKKIVPGNHIGDIGHETEVVAHKNGYEVIKDFTGHGCGVKLHEDPIIPNYGKAGEGTKIVPGMTLCIEPMVMTGSDKYYITANGTVISKNHKLTCHWEHMVLVTETGCDILTQ